jgi:hypothetical protein
MADNTSLDKIRVKVFCTLLDIWAARMSQKDDSDLAEKVGVIAKLIEELKSLVLAQGAKVKSIRIDCAAVTESADLADLTTDEHSLRKMQNSIERFGLKSPPVVRMIDQTYELISGSLQYEACKNLKQDKIQVQLKDCGSFEAEELRLLDAFSKKGLQNIDPPVLNKVLRFYNRFLN